MRPTIILTVYNESLNEVVGQVSNVKELYPQSTIVLCYDGVAEHPIDGVVHVRFSERLKTRSSTGVWMHKWLSAFLDNSDSDYMLKLDPDTILVKPIKNWPVGEVVFGTVRIIRWSPKYEILRIHGGGCGYSRSMVKRIVDNEWLLSPEFVNNPRFQDQEDVMLAHLIKTYSLNYYDHPEFSCGCPISDITSVAHQ